MTKLRIFIASPGELVEERNIVSHLVEELRWYASRSGADVEPVRYEQDSWPGMADDAQDVINQEIDLREINVFIGMMWRRFGTPTHRADSGTQEEFDRAFQCFRNYGQPRIMFYFCRSPFYTDKLDEIGQFAKVVEFKENVEKAGGFVWPYENKLQFERDVRQHLMREIDRQIQLNKIAESPTAVDATSNLRLHRSDERLVSNNFLDERFIFISHVPEDEAFANNLFTAFVSCGLRVWVDTNKLRGGKELATEVRSTIGKAKCFIALLSQKTINSPWIINELREAQKIENEYRHLGYRIIPVLLPGVEKNALEIWFQSPLLTPPVECKNGSLIEILPSLLKIVAS